MCKKGPNVKFGAKERAPVQSGIRLAGITLELCKSCKGAIADTQSAALQAESFSKSMRTVKARRFEGGSLGSTVPAAIRRDLRRAEQEYVFEA